MSQSLKNADTASFNYATYAIQKQFSEKLSQFTELYQDAYTRAQRSATGLISSRIDCIYTNLRTDVLLDFQINTAVWGFPCESSELSDHICVSSTISRKTKSSYDEQHAKILVWVCSSDLFQTLLTSQVESNPDFADDNIDNWKKLELLKNAIRSTAKEVIQRSKERTAKTRDEKIFWNIMLIRGSRTHNKKSVLNALSAYPALQAFCENPVWNNDNDVELKKVSHSQ